MTSVSYPDGIPPDKLITIADWVIRRGVWDITVIYASGFETGASPWTEVEWMNARNLWCHPFYLGFASDKNSAPFTLNFNDDDTAVLFVAST